MRGSGEEARWIPALTLKGSGDHGRSEPLQQWHYLVVLEVFCEGVHVLFFFLVID